jgi:signal transduction protein with GAF and PtsI domain
VLGCLDVIARRVEDLGIRLSICGEMAADPVGVVVLLGLGYRALSMNAYSLPRIRALIRGISIREAQALARSALACRNPGSSRVAIAAALAGLGLDHLLAHGGAFESASTPALAGSPSRP